MKIITDTIQVEKDFLTHSFPYKWEDKKTTVYLNEELGILWATLGQDSMIVSDTQLRAYLDQTEKETISCFFIDKKGEGHHGDVTLEQFNQLVEWK